MKRKLFNDWLAVHWRRAFGSNRNDLVPSRSLHRVYPRNRAGCFLHLEAAMITSETYVQAKLFFENICVAWHCYRKAAETQSFDHDYHYANALNHFEVLAREMGYVKAASVGSNGAGSNAEQAS